MTSEEGRHLWHGDFGSYEVPDRFRKVRIRLDGWPDQRQALGREMVQYFRELDSLARQKMLLAPKP